MTNRLALILAALLLAAVLIDAIALDARNIVFLARKLMTLIDWLAFWR